MGAEPDVFATLQELPEKRCSGCDKIERYGTKPEEFFVCTSCQQRAKEAVNGRKDDA